MPPAKHPARRKPAIKKRRVIECLRQEMQALFEKLKRASDNAREDATDEESRARSKYDTQGLEASYLAAGQAERAEDIAGMMATLSAAPFPPFTTKDPVGEGALVEVDFDGESEWFLFAPCSGGMTVKVDGVEVTLLAPGAPLRRHLHGCKQGAALKQPRLTIKTVC